ncbi:hypothetical protein F5887DRAFT_881134 [Amanita rubescens]|nr:hypothetical protein F5887DRAFT_900411 [Amanita rubescens]KAF8328632.1 hypothetical protein F5887DRAFT_897542 [Amanita rubescens]KAF8347653.1 hypothetical protein F5887DRAFT_881134 [Amanita rubescens]
MLSTLSSLRFVFPDFLVKQFGNIMSDAQMKELLTKWQAFIDTGARPKGKKHKTRSKTPAFHFSVWRRYKKSPFITRDTKSNNCDVRAASDAFLTLLRNHVASKIATFTEYYSPKVWKVQSNIPAYLSLFVDTSSWSAIDFEGAFTTVAVLEGSSEKIHIDANDHGITWILPLGEWTGGTFVIPQLEMEIDVYPGQLLGFSANILAHYCTPVTSGRRIVITMFTCRNILFDSLIFSKLRR